MIAANLPSDLYQADRNRPTFFNKRAKNTMSCLYQAITIIDSYVIVIYSIFKEYNYCTKIKLSFSTSPIRSLTCMKSIEIGLHFLISELKIQCLVYINL